MIAKTRDTLYVQDEGGVMHTIRQGTRGVETKNNRAYKFFDTTRTIAVIFEKDTIVQNPNLFLAKQELEDQEVNIRDVLYILQKNNVSLPSEVIEQLKSL